MSTWGYPKLWEIPSIHIHIYTSYMEIVKVYLFFVFKNLTRLQMPTEDNVKYRLFALWFLHQMWKLLSSQQGKGIDQFWAYVVKNFCGRNLRTFQLLALLRIVMHPWSDWSWRNLTLKKYAALEFSIIIERNVVCSLWPEYYKGCT